MLLCMCACLSPEITVLIFLSYTSLLSFLYSAIVPPSLPPFHCISFTSLPFPSFFPFSLSFTLSLPSSRERKVLHMTNYYTAHTLCPGGMKMRECICISLCVCNHQHIQDVTYKLYMHCKIIYDKSPNLELISL